MTKRKSSRNSSMAQASAVWSPEGDCLIWKTNIHGKLKDSVHVLTSLDGLVTCHQCKWSLNNKSKTTCSVTTPTPPPHPYQHTHSLSIQTQSFWLMCSFTLIVILMWIWELWSTVIFLIANCSKVDRLIVCFSTVLSVKLR